MNELVDYEQFIIIIRMGEDDLANIAGCNVMHGLRVIEKYLPTYGITGASKDTVYSVDVNQLIDAGITKGDVWELRRANWMVEEEYLACFV